MDRRSGEHDSVSPCGVRYLVFEPGRCARTGEGEHPSGRSKPMLPTPRRVGVGRCR